MVGTRGVPARYGGFETAIEEIGQRLVARGHRVTVYCRSNSDGDHPAPNDYLGMDLVALPALRRKSLETLSHTALSAVRCRTASPSDAVLLFNAANACLLPTLRRRGVPVAVHVDGLEWQRAKWSGAGQRFYRWSESLAVRWADALIADAPGISDYYRTEFGATTEPLVYGAPLLTDPADDRLGELDLTRDGFHLVVARFEPENHVEEIVQGYRASAAQLPLVVVGGAPYSDRYTAAIEDAAGGDTRIRLIGPVWDQSQLDQLYAHALVYLHGHSVGGTNPSLLRAMGAGTAVGAWDVRFNHDVLDTGAWYFATPDGVRIAVEAAENDQTATTTAGRNLRSRAQQLYDWDDVTDGYEALARRLANGWSRRGESSGRRTPHATSLPGSSAPSARSTR